MDERVQFLADVISGARKKRRKWAVCILWRWEHRLMCSSAAWEKLTGERVAHDVALVKLSTLNEALAESIRGRSRHQRQYETPRDRESH